MRRFLLALLPLAWLAACTAPAGAGVVTAVSSTLSLEADAWAGGDTIVKDISSLSQAGSLNRLTVSVDALAVNGTAMVGTIAGGSASWTSAAAGHVVLGPIGWATANATSAVATLKNGLDFSYIFTAGNFGYFMLSYAVAAQAGSNPMGLNGFDFHFTGGLQNDAKILSLGTSGAIQEWVTAGSTYTLTLRNDANLNGALGTGFGSMSGTFDFTIPGDGSPISLLDGPTDPPTANPEPASLTLLAVGAAGVLGYARRQRRKASRKL
jgi:hypothetical protein